MHPQLQCAHVAWFHHTWRRMAIIIPVISHQRVLNSHEAAFRQVFFSIPCDVLFQCTGPCSRWQPLPNAVDHPLVPGSWLLLVLSLELTECWYIFEWHLPSLGAATSTFASGQRQSHDGWATSCGPVDPWKWDKSQWASQTLLMHWRCPHLRGGQWLYIVGRADHVVPSSETKRFQHRRPSVHHGQAPLQYPVPTLWTSLIPQYHAPQRFAKLLGSASTWIWKCHK